jgi:transposase
MNLLLTQLLNINEVAVEDYRDIGEHLVLIVEAIKDSSTCPRCGQSSHNVHQSHFHLARLYRILYANVHRKHVGAL